MPMYGASDEPKAEIPIELIEDMQRKGITNNQIIQSLQKDGYTTTAIFDALNKVHLQPTKPGDIKMNTQNNQQSNLTRPNPSQPTSQGPRIPPPQMPPTQNQMSAGQGGVSTEELVEAIIDEKWNDLAKDINKIIEWKEDMSSQIDKLEQNFKNLKDDFDKLHEAILGKVGEYDQHITEVGSEVKAMEKVFSKVLPVFTENVSELSRISDKMKKNK